MAATHSLTIESLGADADGIAAWPDGTPAYIPYALPGERVLAEPGERRGQGRAGNLVAVETPSPHRVAPACRHFGTCGGCALQHLAPPATAAWKTSLLATALHRAGFADPPLAPLVTTPPASRRRADLALRRAGGALLLGLHPTRSHAVIDLEECPVLHPALADLIAPLRAALTPLSLPNSAGDAVLNLLDTGPDLLLRGDGTPTAADRAALAAFARDHRIPRIAFAARPGAAPETLVQLGPVRISLSGIQVTPPPGAFLQASREGEGAIIAAIRAGLPQKRPARARVVELYAGIGTLTFALAPEIRVEAYEGDPAALAALRQAANRAGLAGRVTAHHRDLARQPLAATELASAAAVLLDPPYAGIAPSQLAALAAARPARIIHVGCNPAALARDLRPLAAAGYRVLAATPIDQFLFSPRLESVTILARG